MAAVHQESTGSPNRTTANPRVRMSPGRLGVINERSRRSGGRLLGNYELVRLTD